MTQETFRKANQISDRIDHIDKVIEYLGAHDHKLDPPTRSTAYNIHRIGADNDINLNEGEVEFLKKALLEEKDRLIQEFNNL